LKHKIRLEVTVSLTVKHLQTAIYCFETFQILLNPS